MKRATARSRCAPARAEMLERPACIAYGWAWEQAQNLEGGGLEYEHALLRKALAWRTEPREKLLAQLHPARRRFSRHRRRLEAGVRQRPDLMGSTAAIYSRVDSNICLAGRRLLASSQQLYRQAGQGSRC